MTFSLPARLLPLALLLPLAANAAADPGADLAWEDDFDGELIEASHELDIRIDGMLAEVTATQVVTSTGKRPALAIYRFTLPSRAAIVDLSLAGGRGASSTVAVAIDSEAAIRPASDRARGADPGLLRLIQVDDTRNRRTYELRAYPVAPGGSLTVRTRWLAPLDYTDGRLSLRIPGRGDASNLVRESVSLSLRAPAGARSFARIFGGTRSLASTAGAHTGTFRFTAPAADDLVIEATPVFRPTQRPIAEVATTKLTDARGAIAITLLAPKLAGDQVPDHDAIVLVIDVSRSMEKSGLAAAAAIADGLLAAADRSARVEVVLFDRTARRLFGKLAGNDERARATIRDAINASALANGSDLLAGLDQARQAVDAGSGKTLVAVISDGMWPVELTSAETMERFGALDALRAQVVGITVVPDDAPIPDERQAPLAELVRRTAGRSIALRHGDVGERASRLYSELGQMADVTELAITGGRGDLAIELPERLSPGEGVVAIGWYEGKPPARLSFTAKQLDQVIAWPTRRSTGAMARAAGALAVAAELPQGDGAEAIASAERVRVVSASASLVALDAGDRFSRERLALIKKWGSGVFTRLMAPPERRRNYVFRPLAVDDGELLVLQGETRLTGALDPSIVKRLLQTHIAPRAKICYDRELRRNRGISGSLIVRVEMARGELQHAAIERSSIANDRLAACVVDAAYQIPVPAVKRGSSLELTYLARYPLVFRMRARKADVELGSPDEPGSRPRKTDPLEGIDDPPSP